jgi:hypothetical protein
MQIDLGFNAENKIQRAPVNQHKAPTIPAPSSLLIKGSSVPTFVPPFHKRNQNHDTSNCIHQRPEMAGMVLLRQPHGATVFF